MNNLKRGLFDTKINKNKQEIISNNCESHKMGTAKIPSDNLWHERWPVWGYVGIESAQSSFFGPHASNQNLFPMPLCQVKAISKKDYAQTQSQLCDRDVSQAKKYSSFYILLVHVI